MRRLFKSAVRSGPDLGPPQVQARDLEETGRLHFFYHSRDSLLPVRDVLNQHRMGFKKEPYLERSAENYCVPCLQNNVRGFLKSKEKYLFLLTRRSDCKGDKARYVVGYLTKRRGLPRSHVNGKGKSEHHWAVQGPIKLVAFGEAFPLSRLSGMNEFSARRGTRRLSKEQTRELLVHFTKGRNIFSDCLREVRRLNKKLNDRRRGATSCSNTRGC